MASYTISNARGLWTIDGAIEDALLLGHAKSTEHSTRTFVASGFDIFAEIEADAITIGRGMRPLIEQSRSEAVEMNCDAEEIESLDRALGGCTEDILTWASWYSACVERPAMLDVPVASR